MITIRRPIAIITIYESLRPNRFLSALIGIVTCEKGYIVTTSIRTRFEEQRASFSGVDHSVRPEHTVRKNRIVPSTILQRHVTTKLKHVSIKRDTHIG
jgi:hypothetical protein